MSKNHARLFNLLSFHMNILTPSNVPLPALNAEINHLYNKRKINSIVSMSLINKSYASLIKTNKYFSPPNAPLSYVPRMNTKIMNTYGDDVHVTPNKTKFQPLLSGDMPLMPGLPHDIKKMIGGWDYYVALTHTGIIFRGRWDWNTQHFTPAEQLVTEVNEMGTIKWNIFYALTHHHEIYLWEQYWDEASHTNIFSPAMKVHTLKEVDQFLPGNHLALTPRGEVYLWKWDKHLHRPTSAILLKDVKGIPVSGVIKILPGEVNFALFNHGKVCTWRWDNHYLSPISFLKDPSGTVVQGVTELKSVTDNIFYMLTKHGEVYMWEVYRKYPHYTSIVSPVMKIENLTEVIKIFSGKGKPIWAVTKNGDSYIWNWNGNAHHPTSITLLKRSSRNHQVDLKGLHPKEGYLVPCSTHHLIHQNDLLLSTDTL